MNFEKRIEKVRKQIKKISVKYDIDESKIVWMGGNKYIFVTRNGEEKRVEAVL